MIVVMEDPHGGAMVLLDSNWGCPDQVMLTSTQF